jgi:transposase
MTEIMDTKLRVGRRHKSWPEALKREIVAASFVPGASVSMVARQYDVNTNLVFSWRRRYGEAPGADMPQMVPVVVTPDQPIAAAPAPSVDMIEIELPRGYRVRIGGTVKAAALRIVLDALERR